MIGCCAFVFTVASLLASAAETAPSFRWANKLDWPYMLLGYGLTVDGCGNSYFTGNFQQALTVGSLVLTNSGLFIVKCDRAGKPIWGIRDGATQTTGSGVAVDQAGNVHVLCMLYASNDQAPLAGTNVVGRIALAKYDQTGRALWATSMARGPTGNLNTGLILRLDAAGNSYWTATFSGSATFGETNLTATGYLSGVLVKCNAEGRVLWARSVTSGDFAFMEAPQPDLFGNVYVCGKFAQGASFGVTNLPAIGTSSAFVAKYNAEGDLLWVRQSGGGLYATSDRLALDAAGNCFVQVRFLQMMSFGDIILSNTVPSNFVALAKYDADGNVLWARQVRQGSTRTPVASDAAGNCYVAAEGEDGTVLYAKYDSNGNLLWSKAGRGVQMSALEADTLGYCYVMGLLQATNMSFDSFTLTSSNLSSGADGFLAKLDTTTLPQLTARRSVDSVELSWSILADDFYLESTTNLGSMSWISVSLRAVTDGSSITVTPQTADPATFFRLKRD